MPVFPAIFLFSVVSGLLIGQDVHHSSLQMAIYPSTVVTPRESLAGQDLVCDLETTQATLAPILSREQMLGLDCLLFVQGYWTWKWCPNNVSQYHKEKDSLVQHNLGKLSLESDSNVFVYKGGSVCDVVLLKRETRVEFQCGAQHIQQVRETSSCKYLITVATPLLCSDQTREIRCYSSLVKKPRTLQQYMDDLLFDH